jgi:AcrR family transcriptional regulator
MRSRVRQKAARTARVQLYRRLVCDAAERVFATRGFDGARVEEIAHAAGVSIGTIYRVFPGKKRAIYLAVQEQRGTEILGATRGVGTAAWQRRGDLIDAVLASVASLVEYFVEHPDYLQLVLREERTSWGVGPKRSTREQTAMWREGIDGAVMAMRKGIEDGILVDDDPEAMARAWLAIQQAHLGHWLEQGRRDSAAEVTERLQRQFLRAFCRPEVVATRMAEIGASRPKAAIGSSADRTVRE